MDEHRAVFDAVMEDRLDDAQRLLAEHYRRTASIYQGEARV